MYSRVVTDADVVQWLSDREVVVIDGGMGTELQARGVPMDNELWCGLANVSHWDVVCQAHADFIEAGADVLITNTYPCAPFVFELGDRAELFEEANVRAVQAAQAARSGTAADRDILIAGSLSAYGLRWARERGLSSVSGSKLLKSYRAQADLLKDAGVDVLILEMVHPSWADGAKAAAQSGLPVWLAPATGIAQDGHPFLRAPPEGPPEHGALGVDLRPFVHDNVSAITLMHSHVSVINAALDVLREMWPGPIGAYPHVGEWERPNWIFEDVTPDAFAEHARLWIEHGARLVGGCCGIGPNHIAELRRIADDRRPSVGREQEA
jgi:S-methylmethionine-dependent homocysteine/selenocysteine methylase